MNSLMEIALNEKGNFFVYGEGGIGKTTQLKRLFNKILEKAKDEKVVPIFVDCKALDFDKNKPVLSKILKDYCGDDCTECEHMELLENMIFKQANGYNFFILIDGLNESQNNKYKVINDISRLAESKHVSIVVSSRVVEPYPVFENFKKIKVREFSNEQIIKVLNATGYADSGKEVDLSHMNPILLKILRIPMFLEIFCRTYSSAELSEDMYTKNTVRKADLLQAFLDKILSDKATQYPSEKADPEYQKIFLPLKDCSRLLRMK